MTRDQLNAYLCAILTTALETEPAPFPESTGYLATGMNMTAWCKIKAIMEGAGLVTMTGNAIRLTDAGRKLAREIEAARKAVAP